jgi:hypothetical protein
MILAEVIAQFPRWWKSHGHRYPGLLPETVVARIVARADTVHSPAEYFAEVSRNMWQATQPGAKAPAGDYSGPTDDE